MTARAYVERVFSRDGVAVHLGVQVDGGLLRVAQQTELVWRIREPGEEATHQPPALYLPEDVARALLDALAAHFGGTSEVQTLRKDFLHERGRVDKMIDHLIGRTS